MHNFLDNNGFVRNVSVLGWIHQWMTEWVDTMYNMKTSKFFRIYMQVLVKFAMEIKYVEEK